MLFPPEVDGDVAKGKKFKKRGEDNEAIHFFDVIYPRMLKAGVVKKRYEFIQKPGQCVYVPGDWWHAVLNLDDTIAIT